ncbi:sigma-70 factor, region 1 [Bradyrhizobium sp. LTSP885]|uniref:RNA polymerase sigma factor region1.1 domain-containing protein n=1 Tax=Bradyrhizobium sp. LTSP885 TaxID=1619232 RepID=UPI0005CB3498|nr:RNA polymerase sigma factor region1.1 domain-containing protein [Bradyrhizobium sp. LTSP885]KJC33613.1 sigma-70 factor, region 1 [Bradyrhizobium sp. LTSP885]
MDWSELVRKAVELGGKTCFVTFDQINDLIDQPAEVDPKDIEALIMALSDRGIDLVNE